MSYKFKYIDISYLKSASPSPDFIFKILDLFIAEFPKIKENLLISLKNEDYKTLGEVAHKAKSRVAIIGMENDAKMMKSLELDAKSRKDIETFAERVDAFLLNCENAIIEINDFKSSQWVFLIHIIKLLRL